jgi:Tfp pilus assembly protein PilX
LAPEMRPARPVAKTAEVYGGVFNLMTFHRARQSAQESQPRGPRDGRPDDAAPGDRDRRSQESGYAYLFALLAIIVVTLASTTAMQNMLTAGRRQREEDMIWRGNQIVRALPDVPRGSSGRNRCGRNPRLALRRVQESHERLGWHVALHLHERRGANYRQRSLRFAPANGPDGSERRTASRSRPSRPDRGGGIEPRNAVNRPDRPKPGLSGCANTGSDWHNRNGSRDWARRRCRTDPADRPGDRTGAGSFSGWGCRHRRYAVSESLQRRQNVPPVGIHLESARGPGSSTRAGARSGPGGITWAARRSGCAWRGRRSGSEPIWLRWSRWRWSHWRRASTGACACAPKSPRSVTFSLGFSPATCVTASRYRCYLKS